MDLIAAAQNPTKRASQGHRYQFKNHEVLALASGERVLVARICHSRAWPLAETFVADAIELVPLPMRYFHGDTA